MRVELHCRVGEWVGGEFAYVLVSIPSFLSPEQATRSATPKHQLSCPPACLHTFAHVRTRDSAPGDLVRQ
jgi:hypothetical protein